MRESASRRGKLNIATLDDLLVAEGVVVPQRARNDIAKDLKVPMRMFAKSMTSLAKERFNKGFAVAKINDSLPVRRASSEADLTQRSDGHWSNGKK